MILGVFIEFFRVKIVIGLSKNHCDLILIVGFNLSQNSQYLLIFYRYLPIYLLYLPIFYRHFFRNPNTCARDIKSQNFAEMSGISNISSIFRRFYRFSTEFFSQPIIGCQYLFGADR